MERRRVARVSSLMAIALATACSPSPSGSGHRWSAKLETTKGGGLVEVGAVMLEWREGESVEVSEMGFTGDCCGQVQWSNSGERLAYQRVEGSDESAVLVWTDVLESAGTWDWTSTDTPFAVGSRLALVGDEVLGLGHPGEGPTGGTSLSALDLATGELGPIYEDPRACTGVTSVPQSGRLLSSCADAGGVHSLVLWDETDPSSDAREVIGGDPFLHPRPSPSGRWVVDTRAGFYLRVVDVEAGGIVSLEGIVVSRDAPVWLNDDEFVGVDVLTHEVLLLDVEGAELARGTMGGMDEAWVSGETVLAMDEGRRCVFALGLDLDVRTSTCLPIGQALSSISSPAPGL